MTVIGYLDRIGNIVERDTAEEQVRILNEGRDPGEPPTTIADLYIEVDADDYWQEEIDNQDENGPRPRIYRMRKPE